MDYFENLNKQVKEYFHILCPNDFPYWLNDYINTKPLQRIGKISLSCGTDYSGIFDIKFWYSNLDHSVGVALIIWHFTHDKKMTLSGLFHDIATPAFKHCIDFMNKDYETQESTEERTLEIITGSKEIMDLLQRDNILVSQIANYKIYPIADNKSPKLSADRLEYNFSSGLSFYPVWDLKNIKRTYENITILKNEDNMDELAFKDEEICSTYILTVSKLWPMWICDEDKTVMQFIADMCLSANKKGLLTIDDLYLKSEKQIVNIFANCPDTYLKNAWHNLTKAKKVYSSDTYVLDKYCVKIKPKKRYLNPLVCKNNQIIRIYDANLNVKKAIDEYLKIDENYHYTYYDFDFKPY